MPCQAPYRGGGGGGGVAPAVSERNWWDRQVASFRTPQGGVEMYPAHLASVSRPFTSGTLFATLFTPTAEQRARLPTIRSINALISVAASGLTLAQYGIWDYATGALLASTADFSASVPVQELGKLLTTPLAMPTNPFWVGALFIGTTPPTLAAIAVAGSAGGNVGVQPFPAANQAGLAALPDPIVASGSSAVAVWYGIVG
jgi:hypothetical protein